MPYRKIPAIVLIVCVLIAGAPTRVLADDLWRRDKMLHLLNQVRRNHGLPVLRINAPLSHDAYLHSRAMAQRGYLFHTADLWSSVRAYSPSMWGETIGAARLLRTVRTLWLRSSTHRRILLTAGYRRVGIGVSRGGGLLWVTADFYGG
jgi:uncharacterized protein YkwD